MLNYNTSAHCGSHSRKENADPSGKADAPQVQRPKQRTVLGILSENEQRGRSLSQGSQISKNSSVSDNSHLAFYQSSSSYDMYVEEACEVVVGASGQEVLSDSRYGENDTAALQNEAVGLLLDLSSSSCQDGSMSSEPNNSLMSHGEVWYRDYAEDIHRILRESEMRFRPRPDYLEKHPQITDGMRVTLVDWLVEVVREYKLCSETLHLAVNYLDRFLSCTANVIRRDLQLVGTAALLIAAKYEEISPPDLREFVYATDSTYTKKQLVRMEHLFLKVLDYGMAVPTANQFLRLFMAVHSVCVNTENLAQYVAELSLLEIDLFLEYVPSIVAAGAYCLATYTVNKFLWPDSLRMFTGYTMAEIMPCLTDLHKLYVRAESLPQQAIREKYKSLKYCRVASIPPPAALHFQ